MKKRIVILILFFVVQIVALCILSIPPKEPVTWEPNDYGEYEIVSCAYGEDVLQTVKSTVAAYENEQIQKYQTDSAHQLVFVKVSRVLHNQKGVTVMEYRTTRKTYTSFTDNGFCTDYELLDTVQLWIVATENGASVQIKPTDCNAGIFVNEKAIAYEAKMHQSS